MDGVELLRVIGPKLVNRLSNDVYDPTGVLHFLIARGAICTVHGDSAYHVLAQVLCHLQYQSVLESLDIQSIQERRQGAIELDINHCTKHLTHTLQVANDIRRHRVPRSSCISDWSSFK